MSSETVTIEPEGAPQLLNNQGGALEKSLFAPVYQADLNPDERQVAIYLDEDEAITWWHRNVAKSHYALQGWRRFGIYPDFIFAITQEDDTQRITVLETKGDQLAGNLDATYKQAVLKLMTKSFGYGATTPSGSLELVHEDGTTVVCDLVLFSEWRTRLPELLKD